MHSAVSVGKADVHIHTRYSDGQPTVHQVLEHLARRTDLSVAAIADHDTIEGALEAVELAPDYGVDIIVAEEVSSRHGHIIGLFLKERVQPGMSAAETVAAIQAQGGLAIAAHPFFRYRSEKALRPVLGVGHLIAQVGFDAVEVDNATPFLRSANNVARRFNRAHGHRAEMGNSDAHIVQAIGKSHTLFPGRTAEDLRVALLAGQTAAVDDRYQPSDLAAYLAYWVAMPLHRARCLAS